MDCVVVRYGALGTKSPTVRRRMETQLQDNIATAVTDNGHTGDVERVSGRLLVYTDAVDTASRIVANLPGVVSTSPAVEIPPEVDDITETLVELARARLNTTDREPDTYAVRASRARDDHAFTSPDIERDAGAAIGDVIDATVDLDDPDVTFEADVRPDRAFVFADRHDGPGGLPVGTQAPLVALISGGIDSPVAAFEAMRRGSPVIPIYIDLGEYGGIDHQARAIEACGQLADRAPNHDLRPYIVDGGDTIADLAASVDRGRMLALRRYFFAVAAAIADREDATGIVTGEVLGQKSSQTARNLQVTSAAVDLPIHRPLFAMDKPAITEYARALGTYEAAEIQAGCNRLAPDHPETHGQLKEMEAIEPPELLEHAAADAAAATRTS